MTREEMHVCKRELVTRSLKAREEGHHTAAATYIVGARLLSVIFEGVIELDAINDTLKNVNATLDRLSDIEMDVRPARRQ